MYQIMYKNRAVMCETIEELKTLMDHIEREEGKQPSKEPAKGLIQEAMQLPVSKAEKQEVDMFINKLNGLENTVIDSEKMRRLLDAESIQAVGPKFAALAKKFERVYRYPLEKLLEREGRPGQPTVWRVKGDHLKLIHIFQ